MALRSGVTALVAVLLLTGCATPTPIPPSITDDEAESIVTLQLDRYWAELSRGEDRQFPTFERVAFSTPDTWASVQVSCLIAAGLDAREVSGGFAIDGYGSLSPGEGDRAQVVCLGEYPVDPRAQGFLSDAQVLYAYDYFTERLAPCLQLLGFAVPPAPARSSYADSTRDGLFWTPYGQSPPIEATAEEWSVINAKCPPLPAEPFSLFQPPVPR